MISLPELKLAIKHALDAADTTEDTYLEGLEAAAVAYVERETGRYFGAAVERTEYFDAFGQQTLWLQESPAGPVTVTSDEIAVPATDYSVRGRVLRHVSGWGHPSGAEVAVTYTAGYTAGAEPADIRQAVVQLVTLWYEQRLPVAVGSVAATTVPHTVSDILQVNRRMAL